MARERAELQAQLTQCLEAALNRLEDIWDKIGIVEDQRNERIKVVMLHLSNLMDEMVKEEINLETKLMKSVEKYGQELLHLCKELSLPPHQPPVDLSILKLEKELRTRVDTLAKEKHERLVHLKKLKERDQHLCDIMCTTPYYVPSGAVPSREQLKELEQHVEDLRQEQERRANKFQTTKQNIMKLMEELEESPNTSFERDVICEEEDSFLLSSENMKAMERLHDELDTRQKQNFALASKLRDRISQLWERLQVPMDERNKFNTANTGFRPTSLQALREEISRCELLKLENMKQVTDATREELMQWWDKCYISKDQRDRFTGFASDDYTEELLESHDQEVSFMKHYYEDNKEMLENVTRRQKLFDQFLEFERKASDPNRFFNRGCNLLKEEKARKKIIRELPKVEQEVAEQIEAWERENQKKFLVHGEPFLDYVKVQWEEYHRQKEVEKIQRLQQKAKQTEEEMMYGSKPSSTTPSKRRFLGTTMTPGKTPTKMRKLNDTNKTPGSVHRIGARVNHTGVYSPICMAPRSASRSTSKILHIETTGRCGNRRRSRSESSHLVEPRWKTASPLFGNFEV